MGTVLLVALAVGACSEAEAPLVGLTGATMGTTYTILVADGEGADTDLQAAVDGLLDEINGSLSTYIASSTLSRVNQSPDTTTWLPVDAHFAAVFRRSRDIYAETGGAFNPAVGPLVDAWGFGPVPVSAPPDDATIEALLAVSDFELFQWREAPPGVRKAWPEAALDFSGIAKGYAVDRVGNLIEARGARDYFIEIGGEVRTRGIHPEGRPWSVGIEEPAQNGGAIQTVIAMSDSSLATSGNYRNFDILDGRKVVHILDPATGRAEPTSLLSASVLAADTMTADALATAFMVMGVGPAMEIVEARDGLEAYFISDGGNGAYREDRSSGFPLP